MGWMAIITLLVQIFGPIFADWLRKRLDDRLKKAAEDMRPAAEYGSSAEAVGALFDRAIASTPMLHVAERIALRHMKASALERADSIVAGGEIPKLTDAEVAAITAAAVEAEE